MRAVPAIDHLRSHADRLLGERGAALRRLEGTKKDIKRLTNEGELLDLVQGILRKLIDKEVTTGVQAVERLLTEGLQAVFTDQDLSVRAEVTTQRGKVAVNLLTVQKQPDGSVVEGVSSDAFGGAVSTVESVLLRIIVMKRRDLRPFLLLDETLPAFDSNYVTNMGQFLALVCDRLGIDILLVTHNQALVDAAHKAYRIVRGKDGAKFEVIR